MVFFVISCGSIPSDPRHSYEKAISSALSVGYSVNPPWVTDGDSVPGGIESSLIKGFALANGMRIAWEPGSEQTLMKKLTEKKLHIVISGLRKDTPWKKEKIGFTRPYFNQGKEKMIIAVIQGENRLIYELEKFLFSKKDSIEIIINEASKEF